ncbi:hypothetical protein FGO68_gene1505 [Halteria grandinella]|uniref:Uncharacterized protein n=1 Tax=Halteria grandinella TaxID=5974 RepID=A0A8J8T8C0_HALGN|nr:hypothetical protein FGO68_gene1505 [Halteria grandinella]
MAAPLPSPYPAPHFPPLSTPAPRSPDPPLLNPPASPQTPTIRNRAADGPLQRANGILLSFHADGLVHLQGPGEQGVHRDCVNIHAGVYNWGQFGEGAVAGMGGSKEGEGVQGVQKEGEGIQGQQVKCSEERGIEE